MESPISAALRALDRSEDPGDPAYGFLRRDAALSIVFIGDEDDCSRAEGANASLGDSAGCWKAAISDDPALLDLDVFFLRLEAIERDKQQIAGSADQRVYITAVAGVPSALPEQQPDYDGGLPGDGCIRAGRLGSPTVRIRDVVAHFDPWLSEIVSVCGEDWLSALACLPRERDERPFCLDLEPLRFGEEAADACIATETSQGETRRLPECVADYPSWMLPPDAEACAAFLGGDLRDEVCIDREQGQALILRREQPFGPGCVEVSCATDF